MEKRTDGRVSNTSLRLKEIIKKRGYKQVDILNLMKPYSEKYNMKINKSNISQWVSGINEPQNDNLYILAKALNVNETWLMGYDVPEQTLPQSEQANLDYELISKYSQLSQAEQNEILELIDFKLSKKERN